MEKYSERIFTTNIGQSELSRNGGSYSRGFRILFKGRKVVNVRFWTSADFGCCPSCGGFHSQDCGSDPVMMVRMYHGAPSTVLSVLCWDENDETEELNPCEYNPSPNLYWWGVKN